MTFLRHNFFTHSFPTHWVVHFEFFTFAWIQLYHREGNFFSLRRYTFITALIKKYQRTANDLIQKFAEYQYVVHIYLCVRPERMEMCQQPYHSLLYNFLKRKISEILYLSAFQRFLW